MLTKLINCRFPLIQDPFTHDDDMAELIDNAGQEINQVETDYSVDALKSSVIYGNLVDNLLIPSNQVELADNQNELIENTDNAAHGDDYYQDYFTKEPENFDSLSETFYSDKSETVKKVSDDVGSEPSLLGSHSPVSARGSQMCPDNLSACLSACRPVLLIRVLAFTYCKRECWERCGEGEEGEDGGLGRDGEVVGLEVLDNEFDAKHTWKAEPLV